MTSRFLRSFKDSFATAGTLTCGTLSAVATILFATSGDAKLATYALGTTAVLSAGGFVLSVANSEENQNPSLRGKIVGGASGIAAGAVTAATITTLSIVTDELMAQTDLQTSFKDSNTVLNVEEPIYPALERATFG